MNPEHAVDIYLHRTNKTTMLLRRRDSSFLVLQTDSDPKSIGHAAWEAIEPKSSNTLDWQKTDASYRVEWGNVEFVVAWRAGGKILVCTPICDWGKAPDIHVSTKPSHQEFGEAILKQYAYSISKKGFAT